MKIATKQYTIVKNMSLKLRPYQEIGKNFLYNSNSFLLADDMGLGKTIQTISALKERSKKHGIMRTLIVVPNSLKTNWANEFKTWYPEVIPTLLEGNKNDRLFYLKNSKSVIIATYEQIRTTFAVNENIPNFNIVIFDEAQRLKNSNSSTFQCSKLIKSDTFWMLSGTPLENSETDIVNLFRILRPDTIHKGFNHLEIRDGIKPFFLRRKKEECLDELPELIEENVYIDMTKAQKFQYEKLMEEKMDWYKSGNLLAFITELKKICNFPDEISDSAKLKNLNNILKVKNETQEKVIIFSQYVDTLKKIESSLPYSFMLYDGSLTSDEKDRIIDKFQNSSENNFLLMSIKSGGVGLNLQQANTVILFDRWWNPATEQQAIARAHRMGNKNAVHAIKYIVSNSIEEKIIEILHNKEYIFKNVIENKEKITSNKNLLAQLIDLEVEIKNNIIMEGDKND
jgi:SNF2 family DNA or RNA helicase